MKKLVIFTLIPHSIVDSITNSSSELFVGKSSSKENIEELLRCAYPNYRNEYNEIRSIDDLIAEELDTYFQYACSAHCWPATKNQYPILPGFTFDELYTLTGEQTPWNDEPQYELKNNSIDPHFRWSHSFVTDENLEEIKNKLDPKRQMYFLFSSNENPDWDYQEILMSFMDRFHLG